jgi:hypothetical protein
VKIELTGEEMDRIDDAWRSSPKASRQYILPYIFREVEKIIAERFQPVTALHPKWDNEWVVSATTSAAGAIRNCTFELLEALRRSRNPRPGDTAAIVGLEPSDQFVPPILNLDGPSSPKSDLLERAAARIRHDHSYPMDFDQNHHCEGCDLEEELKNAVVQETKKWRGLHPDFPEEKWNGAPVWLEQQRYNRGRAREMLDEYYGPEWRLQEQSTLTLAWVSVDVERPSDAG